MNMLIVFNLVAGASAVVHDQMHGIPHGWAQSHHNVDNNTSMQLHVALPYQNLNQLEAELAAVSTPGSPRYGQYQDLDSQTTMFAPSHESATHVKRWLAQHGAAAIEHRDNVITFSTTVKRANAMLGADFQYFTNGKFTKLRTRSYSIPDYLVGHIDLVHPTTYFGSTKARAAIFGIDSTSKLLERQSPGCTTISLFRNATQHNVTAFCPEALRDLYKTAGYSPDPRSGSNVSFANFLEEVPSQSDLSLFEQSFGLTQQNFTTLANLNNAIDAQNDPDYDNLEANLDVQYISTLADGLPVGSYLTGGRGLLIPDLQQPNASQNFNEPYDVLFSYMLAQPNAKLPWVLSISYGDEENTIPEKYATRVCNQIGMLGLRGRTILGASGDDGPGAVCRDNRPAGNLNGKPQFDSYFPEGCPYMTAVGGTQYNCTNETCSAAQLAEPESAWRGSGGAFSRYFPTAWYQKQAVKEYLENHISADTKDYYASNGYVNFSGRAFPDIAAHSEFPRYAVAINGEFAPIAGTSGATPVVAGIIGLLNDARFRAGKPAMGFLNPWLYTAGAAALTDITVGSAVGCLGPDAEGIDGVALIPYASWNGTVGWDPATGLGTPDFPKMKEAALEVFDWQRVPQSAWRWPPRGGWVWYNGHS